MSDTRKFYDFGSLAEASYVLFDKLNNDYSDEKVRLVVNSGDIIPINFGLIGSIT